MIFRTDTLTALKFPQSGDAPIYVDPARSLVWQIYNPATKAYSFYTAQLHRRVSKLTNGTVALHTMNVAFNIEECRVRIIKPATASATGVFNISGTPITGATAIPLDAAAGTIHTSVPTGADTGAAAAVINFVVTGDTSGTLMAEVEIVYRPTGQFTVTV
jgi:hypothetical protein